MSLSEEFLIFLSNKQVYASPIQIGNKPSDFYSHLPEVLNLSDDFEVGLLELRYKKDWSAFPSKNVIEFTCDKYFDKSESLIFDASQMESIHELMIGLNEFLREIRDVYQFKKLPRFNYTPENLIEIEPGECINAKVEGKKHYCFPILPEVLNRKLGFFTNKNEFLNQENLDKFIPDPEQLILEWVRNIETGRTELKWMPNKSLSRDIYLLAKHRHDLGLPKSINVYTDLVETSMFQNNLQNILANLTFFDDKRRNQSIVIPIDSPAFHNLSHFTIQDIHIELRDENGRLIEFNQENKIWLILEFRKKQYEVIR